MQTKTFLRPLSAILSRRAMVSPRPALLGRQARALALVLLAAAGFLAGSAAAFTPTGPALANGKSRFLGCCYSTAQASNFTAYFNQVTPENAGKWGSVEATRGTMNWTELDAAYAFAKTNGLKFRFHILVWGSQQPAWISTLSTAEKRTEIEQWFAAVAARYPDLDYIEVVNEPLHAPPNGQNIAFSTTPAANYADALGGTGVTGWDWIITAFQLARTYFPGKKLVLNEYGVTNDASSMARYVGIVNLLKERNLIDVVAFQAHSFATKDYATTTLSANLATLAATGVPIMVTEMDIDDTVAKPQLADYQRIFPLFWEHPSVIGITLWGFRPGLWRDSSGANLVLADGTEKPAMVWLKQYVRNVPPVVTAGQTFALSPTATDGTIVGTVQAMDVDAGTILQNWAITGGTGADYFAIAPTTGQLTVANRAGLDLAGVGAYTLTIKVADGMATGAAETVTILTPAGAPRLTAQPADCTVIGSNNASFAVSILSPVAVTLQWQVSTDGGGAWVNLSDSGGYASTTGATLIVTGVTPTFNGYRYRCVVSNGTGTQVTSDVATLTVRGRNGADFNGDGNSDILWENNATGAHVFWSMNGATYSGWGDLGFVPVEWRVAGNADFNADGRADIVWENTLTGARVVWFMNGATCIGSTTIGWVSADWRIAGAGDFNGDGSPDILWENPTTGAHVMWFMNGTSYTDWADLGFVPTEWRVVGTGDFNTDGKADLVWENTITGARVIWLMNGATCAASAELGFVSPDWHIAGTGDFNGDGQPDILWENPATGARVIWYMNGTAYAGWADLGFIPTEWGIRN